MADSRFWPEYDHPCINSDQEIAGEGQHYQQYHQISQMLLAARDQQRQWIGHNQTNQSSGCRNSEGFQEDFGIENVAEKELVSLQRKTMFNAMSWLPLRRGNRGQSPEFARKAERSHDHDQAGENEEYDQKQQWRARNQKFRKVLPSGSSQSSECCLFLC